MYEECDLLETEKAHFFRCAEVKDLNSVIHFGYYSRNDSTGRQNTVLELYDSSSG